MAEKTKKNPSAAKRDKLLKEKKKQSAIAIKAQAELARLTLEHLKTIDKQIEAIEKKILSDKK